MSARGQRSSSQSTKDKATNKPEVAEKTTKEETAESTEEVINEATDPLEEVDERSEGEIFAEMLLTRLAALEEQNQMLSIALSKFATLTGHGNYLKEFGLQRWEPGKKDMSKYG